MTKMEMASYKEFVRTEYGRMPTKEIASRTGRTIDAIHCMARKLGVSRHYKGPPYIYGGYRFVLTDPSARGMARYTAEHRLVMENKLGRALKPEERVHHIDGNRLNNEPSNLRLYANAGYHCVAEHYRTTFRQSETAKEKIRLARSKQVIRHSQETRAKISAALKAYHQKRRLQSR